jgi:sugar O-acyltransferase (sialic acid O-acetyltransferase NeuD family)
MEGIVIIGGKGTALNIAEQIDDAYRRFGCQQRVIGFAIDDRSLGPTLAGFPVLCGTREVAQYTRESGAKIIFALYRPDVMRERVELLAGYGLARERFATFVHPQAHVSKSARIGRGSVILAHATLMMGVVVGDFCLLNSQVLVEHDVRIEDSCFLSAGACIGADAVLGQGTFVGMRAVLRPTIHVGRFAFVGMGSVVTRDVEQYAQVYGNPARRAR